MFYVLALIGFVVVVYFLSKMNKGLIDRGIQKSQQQSSLPELAQALGLTHEVLSPAGGKDVFMETGERITGTYQGFPMEMVFAMKAKHGDQITVKYSYSIQKTVALTVQNPSGKTLEILPKYSQLVAKPTGVASFDESLSLAGNLEMPEAILESFGRLGWMNLRLKGNRLELDDNYYEGSSGMMNMSQLTSKHPVWGNTPTNPKMDLSSAKAVIDTMVEIARIVTTS